MTIDPQLIAAGINLIAKLAENRAASKRQGAPTREELLSAVKSMEIRSVDDLIAEGQRKANRRLTDSESLAGPPDESEGEG